MRHLLYARRERDFYLDERIAACEAKPIKTPRRLNGSQTKPPDVGQAFRLRSEQGIVEPKLLKESTP
jgi:hypothetical protein